MEKGEIVKRLCVEGVLVEISDRSFSEKTEEELNLIRKNARQAAWNIQMNALKDAEKNKPTDLKR